MYLDFPIRETLQGRYSRQIAQLKWDTCLCQFSRSGFVLFFKFGRPTSPLNERQRGTSFAHTAKIFSIMKPHQGPTIVSPVCFQYVMH